MLEMEIRSAKDIAAAQRKRGFVVKSVEHSGNLCWDLQ